jgi:hypothetical protein
VSIALSSVLMKAKKKKKGCNAYVAGTSIAILIIAGLSYVAVLPM